MKNYVYDNNRKQEIKISKIHKKNLYYQTDEFTVHTYKIPNNFQIIEIKFE